MNLLKRGGVTIQSMSDNNITAFINYYEKYIMEGALPLFYNFIEERFAKGTYVTVNDVQTYVANGYQR